MAKSVVACEQCGKPVEVENGTINRARRRGNALYCGRTCGGLGRRKWKTEEQKSEEKAVYDMLYRANNAQMLKEKKAAHFQATYDPVVAALKRKKTMPRHVEYCRRPEYKEWKQEYDRRYRAEQEYGEFADAFLLVTDINREILERATRYEIDLENGKLGKAQRRKREYARIVGGEPQKHALGHASADQERRNAAGAG